MPIIQYIGQDLALPEQSSTLGYEIMPWVFGKIMFNRIKEMNDIRPVEQFDLFVSTRTNNNPFSQYDIQSAGSSFWRQRSDKELILQTANSLRQTIMPYLAEDLDENAIETLLGQPPTTWQERPAPPPQRHTDGNFWDAVALQATNIAPEEDNGPPPPRPRMAWTPHGMEPRSEPDPSRNIDLNSILDSI